jgi:hypothetical protein
MIKEFLSPDWRKLIVYLVFVIIFMTETLLIRSLFQEDYVVTFLSSIYNYFFTEIKDYVNFFTLAFFFYIAVLAILYLLSCIVILITEKIKK